MEYQVNDRQMASQTGSISSRAKQASLFWQWWFPFRSNGLDTMPVRLRSRRFWGAWLWRGRPLYRAGFPPLDGESIVCCSSRVTATPRPPKSVVIATGLRWRRCTQLLCGQLCCRGVPKWLCWRVPCRRGERLIVRRAREIPLGDRALFRPGWFRLGGWGGRQWLRRRFPRTTFLLRRCWATSAFV